MVEQPAQIYKIVPEELWRAAKLSGRFVGAPVDLNDGFIHFSTAKQLQDTAKKHFSGQDHLLLVTVDASALGENLKYEVSRGGDLFPHLYAALDFSAVIAEEALPLDTAGQHVFPEYLK